MNGRERISQILAGGSTSLGTSNREPLPVMPIIHSGLAPLFGVPLGAFFTQAEVMAQVIVRGCREFRLDGVQLSMGVTADAEALGARVEQPADGGAVLKTLIRKVL